MQMCGSNKIANLPQSPFNGTMSQCSEWQLSIAISAVLAANAYATHTHAHTNTHSGCGRQLSGCVCVCFGVGHGTHFWLAAASKITHWERHAHTQPNKWLYIQLYIYAYIYLPLCIYVFGICDFLLVLLVGSQSWLHAWVFCVWRFVCVLFSYPKYIFVLASNLL